MQMYIPYHLGDHAKQENDLARIPCARTDEFSDGSAWGNFRIDEEYGIQIYEQGPNKPCLPTQNLPTEDYRRGKQCLSVNNSCSNQDI